jgi:hypothetical protein
MFSAAAFLSAITAVNAWGAAGVANSCNFPIYIKEVSQQNPDSQAPITLVPGQVWASPYKEFRTNGVVDKSKGGVSIKVSRDRNNFQHITQLEYTLDGNIWYDGSNVDCAPAGTCPFQREGMSISSSDRSCPRPVCRAGGCGGNDFYQKWNDDRSTKACQPNTDIILHLCHTNYGYKKRSLPVTVEETKIAKEFSA